MHPAPQPGAVFAQFWFVSAPSSYHDSAPDVSSRVPIDRQGPHLDEARFPGDLHHVHEQRVERRPVLLPKLGNRSVAGKSPAANTR